MLCSYWWQTSAVLKTDHSPSMFPPLDVTTRVLPLTEHKRGLFPPLANQNHLPPGPENWLVLSPDLLGERAPLVWTNVRASSGALT